MPSLYIGLISGTSLDAVDAALLDLSGDARLVCHHSHPIPATLRDRILAMIDDPAHAGLQNIGRLETHVGRLLADAALALMGEAKVKASDIKAIGSHGQTLWHEPDGETPFTWQIGDPNIIAANTGITTVADFRRRDLAHGGQGAPLAPAFHAAVFASRESKRVIVNIGGFSNLTLLDPGAPTTGFDSGPGNVLMDAWVQRHLGKPYDQDGDWAAEGDPIPALLEAMLAHPYFALPPPKSTGREVFHLPWLESLINQMDNGPRLSDVQSTLCELTAQTIADAVIQYADGCDQLYVCGGGQHNRTLMATLKTTIHRHLPAVEIDTTSKLGIAPDWVEAAMFAWLAHETLAGREVALPSITGSRRADVLGAVFPIKGQAL